MQQIWCGVKEDTLFDDLSFYQVPDQQCDDIQYALHTNLGSITVLNRMTGFGWRDVETGYRDMNGKFWLAGGAFDVRVAGCLTFMDAVNCVKENANTCIGV